MPYQHTTEINFAGEDLAVDVEYDFELGDEGQHVFYVISATGRWTEMRPVYDPARPFQYIRIGFETVDKSPSFPNTGPLLSMLQASEELEAELAEVWGRYPYGGPTAAELARDAGV